VEPFSSGIAFFFRFRSVSGLSTVIYKMLRRVLHLYHVLITSLGSFQFCKLCLSSESLGSGGKKFEIFPKHVAYLYSIL